VVNDLEPIVEPSLLRGSPLGDGRASAEARPPIPLGFAVRIDPWWRVEVRQSIRPKPDIPAVVMNHRVVMSA
jgi:hypothetical protein